MRNVLFVAVFIALLAVVIASVARIRHRRELLASPPTQFTDPATPLGPSEAEAWVRGHITEIAETQFPENLGLEWRIHGIRHRDGLLFAEVEPDSADVGYSRFQFAFSYAGSPTTRHIATYCLESGQYTLLSTSRDAPKMPRVLD
jgi:hypothetical protein